MHELGEVGTGTFSLIVCEIFSFHELLFPAAAFRSLSHLSLLLGSLWHRIEKGYNRDGG